MVTMKQPPRRATATRTARTPVSAPAAPPEPVIEAAPPAPEPVSAAPEPQAAPHEESRPSRAERVPLGTQRAKLAYEGRPGFVRRWFNEDGGRIQAARAAGYTHVKKDGASGEAVRQIVGVAKTGGALHAYLMEIPLEYYEEDTVEKDRPLRQFDADLRRGAGPGKAPGEDGRYVPIKPDGSPRIEIKDSTRLRP